MNLDIKTTVSIIFFLLLILGVGIFISAIRAFREANRLRFFLKKRKILSQAWKLVFFAVVVFGGAILFNRFAEPITYQVFEPSPTITLTPTVTLTATVTLTPTITITPTLTITPEFTPIPEMPVIISDGFTSEITPNPEARFSAITFARRLNGDYQPIDPSDRFDQPNQTLYGSYSYENMIPESQWSSLWFRDGELVGYESIPWNGASGGVGATDLTLPQEEWLPGFYEVQIFVGEIWKASGTFEIFGEAPTPTITPSATLTPLPTETPEPTETPLPTATQTLTPMPENTAAPTATSTATQTPVNTQAPTQTARPTSTATFTLTPLPTRTATFTLTPTITLTPQPTRWSTIFR